MSMSPDVSVCFVSLNCRDVFRDCLRLLPEAFGAVRYEVIVCDNASTDGTVEMVRQESPHGRIISNSINAGFTHATNQCIDVAEGRLVMWLNTDVLPEPGSLEALVTFLDGWPTAGVAGPRVLNPDRTFQAQCRRGLPTPVASLAYLLHLDRLFPGSRRLGAYLCRGLPIDEPSRVTAISGCCLLTRAEVISTVGPLDERIFAYGEDLDWCIRAAGAGWEVWYRPEGVIVHLKGMGGAHVRPYQKVRGIHRGMWIFYLKHLAERYPPPVAILVWLGIHLSFGLSLIGAFIRNRSRGHS